MAHKKKFSYNFIINPKTNRKVSINSSLGKSVINSYLNYLSGGSAAGVSATAAIVPSFLKPQRAANVLADAGLTIDEKDMSVGSATALSAPVVAPAASVPHGRVIACAIGGPLDERGRRAALAKKLFPSFKHQYQKVGSDVVDDKGFTNVVPGKIAYYPIPLSSAPQFKSMDSSSIPIVDYACVGPTETLLMIGHTSFDPIVSVEMLRGAHKNSSIYIQGPGFNIGLATGHGISALHNCACEGGLNPPSGPKTAPKYEHKTCGWKPSGFADSLNMLKSIKKNVKSFAAPVCPSYSQAEWSEVLGLYQGGILELHQYGLGAFFTSRFDGSFYRQFGLAKLTGDHRQQFELAVIDNLLVEIGAGGKYETEVNRIRTALNAIPPKDFDGNAGKGLSGDKGDALINMYKLWPKNTIDGKGAGDLMPKISKAIMKALNDVPSYVCTSVLDAACQDQFKTKEFDGYVCHCMLADAADIPHPNPSEHLEIMKAAVDNTGAAYTSQRLTDLRRGLYNILQKGNLVVMHDLGLDPMVDDFVALSIINKLL